MNIQFEETLKALERKLLSSKQISSDDLHCAYALTVKLRSQLLGVIYEQENFGAIGTASNSPKLAEILTDGAVEDEMVTLTIHEPLPSAKELTSAVQDHWLELIHAAIGKAAREHKLPYFEKAFVWIAVTTPSGTNNTQLWDTSNRAINLVINNLKGIFFKDDNMEHMAFGVTGKWGQEGATVIRILSFD